MAARAERGGTGSVRQEETCCHLPSVDNLEGTIKLFLKFESDAKYRFGSHHLSSAQSPRIVFCTLLPWFPFAFASKALYPWFFQTSSASWDLSAGTQSSRCLSPVALTNDQARRVQACTCVCVCFCVCLCCGWEMTAWPQLLRSRQLWGLFHTPEFYESGCGHPSP